MSAAVFSSSALDRLTAREIVSVQKSRDGSLSSLSSLLKRTGTCRNLFGPVDHNELRQELTTRLREINEQDRLRWNFDFGAGRPLDGELVWEPAEDCPAFYRERIRTDLSGEPKGERSAQAAPQCGDRAEPVKRLNHEKETDRRNPKTSRKTPAHVRTRGLTDRRITDFYGKRRRTDSGKTGKQEY